MGKKRTEFIKGKKQVVWRWLAWGVTSAWMGYLTLNLFDDPDLLDWLSRDQRAYCFWGLMGGWGITIMVARFVGAFQRVPVPDETESGDSEAAPDSE